jgi:hypothetical protein
MKPMYKVTNNAYKMNFWFPTKEMAIEDIHYYTGEELEWHDINNNIVGGNIVMMSSYPKNRAQDCYTMIVEYFLESPRGKENKEVIE